MLKTFVKYFAQGLLITVPLALTAYVVYKLFTYAYHLFDRFNLNIHPLLDPIIIILVLVALIFLIGRLASTLLFKSIFDLFENLIEQAPVIKHIYSPIKDFLQAFVGNKKRFTKPVRILTNPVANIEELGFITQEDLVEFGINDKIAVYLPQSYAFAGRLLIVPKENVKPIELKSGDAMKFILTGGVTDVNEN